MKRYRYSLLTSLMSAGPPSIFVFIGLGLLIMWLGAILGVLPEHWGVNRQADGYISLLLGSVIFLVLGGTLLTFYTEIIVNEDGMKVRAFIFKWMFIPWIDVLDITVPPIPSLSDPSLWRFIQVKRLTIFHKLASLSYRTGSNPVVIINKHLRGYEELVQIVENHVEQNQATSGAAHSFQTN